MSYIIGIITIIIMGRRPDITAMLIVLGLFELTLYCGVGLGYLIFK